MAVYQPSPLELALIRVNRASDLAESLQRGSVYFRAQSGETLEGAIPDLSLEAAQRRSKVGEEILAVLSKVDDAQLPHEFALTAKLLRYYAQAWSKTAKHYWLACDVLGILFYGPFAQTAYTGGYALNLIKNQLAGWTFDKPGDTDRYLGVLSEIARMLRQIHARTAGQAERGIRIHKPQLPAVRKLLEGMRASAAGTYAVSAPRLGALPQPEAAARAIQRRVDEEIVPALDALVAQLDAEYERQAPEGVGMDKLPGGRAVYEDLVKLNTTMGLSIDQVHAAGHARMARVEQEMAELRANLGFKGTAAEFNVHLRQQPGAVAKTPEDIGEKMRKHKDRIEARFDEFFAQRTPNGYDVTRLQPALEGSMTWGYYEQPTVSEKRGLYHYNGSRLDSQAVLGAASLVFHELVPGHHLHFTLQGANENLPPLRRIASVNAFNEGWAEYAATLAGEMGLYDDPYDRYGRLIFDAFLTSRLVVCTGMNALGWSWEQAKQYMREHTLCAEGEIESETLRYSCGLPAQALAYKLGDEEILRMRAKVKARLQDKFDHRDFHSAVLGGGSMPLPVLEWHLDRVFAA